jgi:hypothetical protein
MYIERQQQNVMLKYNAWVKVRENKVIICIVGNDGHERRN